MKPLDNRIALVTGATQGIGLAIARKLMTQGARVIVNDLVPNDAAETLLEKFKTSQDKTPDYAKADLSDPIAIETMMAHIRDTYGQLDILINNAGIQHVSTTENFPVDAWNRMVAVNLSAPFHTMRLAIPLMRAGGWGRIVNIASISGLRARAGKPGYVATKHGLIGLTKSVALELADTNITCNAVCPGWVLTSLVQAQINRLANERGLNNEDATRALLGARQPSGRFVTAGQIADVVDFLCSDSASEVRGAAWAVDGATTAQ